eukprot:TRINITY_DN405_c0_g1_i3.p1 TRINITY_DN405_c0_g1~~TRINITY_DN405_c0_g1_i3.p1  ORF type:complete len:101 (-),score=12.17 TRINITY_DN405_c0_g1_i3:174-476(-)
MKVGQDLLILVVFLNLLETHRGPCGTTVHLDDLISAFQVLDTEKTGYIPSTLLATLLGSMVEVLSKEQINKIITLGDPGGTGKVAYKELVTLFSAAVSNK